LFKGSYIWIGHLCMNWKTHDICYPELAQKSPGSWKLLTFNEWQSVYEVRSHPSSSSFIMSSSPITIRLYSGLHHDYFFVLLLLTGVDRKEVWNVRRGGTSSELESSLSMLLLSLTQVQLNHIVRYFFSCSLERHGCRARCSNERKILYYILHSLC